jgi:hypothetical protein
MISAGKMKGLTMDKPEKKLACQQSMPAPKKSTALQCGDQRFTQEKQT